MQICEVGRMKCVNCPYLSSFEIADGGRMDCCNAHILEDGNGHPIMSRYVTHDWCPECDTDKRKKVK